MNQPIRTAEVIQGEYVQVCAQLGELELTREVLRERRNALRAEGAARDAYDQGVAIATKVGEGT